MPSISEDRLSPFIRLPNGKNGRIAINSRMVAMLRKVYGDAEAARLQKLQRDAIVNQRSEVYAYDADASLNPKTNDPPAPFINLQRTELVPEFAGAYAAAL